MNDRRQARPRLARGLRAGAASVGIVLLVAPGAPVVAATPDATGVTRTERAQAARALLAEHCYACHGPDRAGRKAGLRLDTERGATRERDGGAPAIVPGAADASDLIARITAAGSDRMPPTGPGLSAPEIALLRAWIDEGAAFSVHWAFRPPAHRSPPAEAGDTWSRDPIDRFVLARLRSAGLEPAPEADRATLLTRAALDLIGLPPEPAAIDAFVNDPAPDAWRHAVARLLARPAFGEHWATPWLDLARYADTKGYEADRARTIWPWRDWVVRAYNADMPFDRFTIEQVAGDLLPDADDDTRLATAFHRNTMTNDEGGTDDEEFRVAAVMDRVETTMSAWMGLTMNCARCHDHRYDPFTQEEYFRLYAVFDQTADADRMDDAPLLPVPDPETIRAVAAQRTVIAGVAERVQRRVATLAPDEAAPAPASMVVVVGDDHPAGSITHATAGPAAWTWEELADAPEGTRGLAQRAGTGFAQLFAVDPLAPPALRAGDTLVVSVWLDPEDPPREIMLQWRASGDWNHRAYWGANEIDLGPDGTPARRRRGERPPLGAWIELSTPIADVGLRDGDRLDGIAFSQFAGHARFDAAGIVPADPADDRLHAPRAIGFAAWRDAEAARGGIGVPAGLREALTAAEDDPALRAWHAAHVDPTTRRLLRTEAAALDDAYRALDTRLESAPRVPVMATVETPRETRFLHRGSFLAPGDVVTPGVPDALPPVAGDGPIDRLAFARWLVDERNPLTARVFVNRVWARLFGRGLVETEEDFGIMGTPPSHPALLDDLAVRFVESGWSLKWLLATITDSATYRQAAVRSVAAARIDPDNRLLSHAPRVRLPAEVVRDRALAVSGLLSPKMGGPSVFPPQPEGIWQIVYNGARWETSTGEDRHRRSLYTYWRRTSPYPSAMLFDATSREVCTVRRIRTNTPLQALATMNDPALIEAAQALARRMMTSSGASPGERIRRGYRLALGRTPRETELETLEALYRAEHERFAARPDAARSFAASEAVPLAAGDDPADVAALTLVANTLMNLDEFLNRP